MENISLAINLNLGAYLRGLSTPPENFQRLNRGKNGEKREKGF